MERFLCELASKAPIPGGGGASAVGAAIGTALGEMVANLTAGKKKYAESQAVMEECLEKMSRSRERFLFLSKEDERVFLPLSKAYGIKAETEEEQRKKDEYMERCLMDASQVPMAVMKECMAVMECLEIMAEKGSRLAVSDAGVGIQFIRAGLLGAVMNVYINTKSMKNKTEAERINREADLMVKEGTERADRIYEMVVKAVRR